MKFGLGVPTGTEGLMYPVPYADPEQAVRLAVEAERLGFDSVWGNDHVTTQQYVRAEFDAPPRFYDPYLYLSYVAACTSRLRLATAITVMAFRHPVVAAKQAATLDQLSGGRFILGVGIGAYREETDAMWPGNTLHRGRQAEEFLASLETLLRDRRSSFHGEFLQFEDVESFPKPAQATLPILSGGNAVGSKQRAARYGTGWLPAVLSPAEVAAGLADIRREAEAIGRVLPADFDVAPQLSVAMGTSEADAMARFERTQLHQHMRSLSKSTLKGQQDGFAARNLVGSTAQIQDQVHAYAEAGVTTLSALLFACTTVDETLDQMARFAEEVIAPVNAGTTSTTSTTTAGDAL
ncbi:LLM class flavin-dependent oxidoreductase [Cellulomonas triticagri]|uniref:LLM class flavin-dependent oxidoreductase n=1 Tax=Cellulomonas triticagri TaxID=2483352 RepID=A0A3M2JCY3_9CELL|nr:LLM class flavin-dependent oxidoreductase [Cellulomonas triticagri]RMI09433.1 LLM class flavin-dependent oxidoreductase [Cellulomonas triticagri]